LFNRIILLFLLFGTWLVLSGVFSQFFIGLGIFSCLFAVFVAGSMSYKSERQVKILGIIFNLITYSIWLVKEIVISTIDVTVKMWQIEPDISPTIEWIKTPLNSDAGITIFGNSITLTPGTVTVDVMSDGKIQVHSLTKDGMEDLKKGKMLKKVLEVVGE
jgi:multicomponent Na+:H+ antiporter subunit E